MRTRYLLCLVALSWIVALPSYALEPLKASKFTLSNGLRVEVVYQPKSPIVSHMLWFQAGSSDEPVGKSGVAHFLEHMMFKGTPKHPQGEYEALVERMGGQQNAFTTDDFTAYYATVAREKLPALLELEADRVKHLAPAKGDYAGELQVVMEERRMRTDNNPSARMHEQLEARLFAPHPYAIPVIGWMHDIEKLTEADVMDFFHKHYAPSNAVLLLVGDITPQDAKKLAEKYYASWRSDVKPSVRVWSPPAPANNAISLMLKDGNVSQPQWQRIYLAPSLGIGDKKQVFSLVVLAQMLCGSDASVLYQELVVKQQKLTSLSCNYNAFMRGAGTVDFELIPAQNVSLQEAAAALDTALADIINAPENTVALRRAKNSLKVETIYARDGISSMATVYGQLMMLGLGADFFNGWADAISSVTWPEIQATAKDVLLHGHHATGWVVPDPTQPKKASAVSHMQGGMGKHVR